VVDERLAGVVAPLVLEERERYMPEPGLHGEICWVTGGLRPRSVRPPLGQVGLASVGERLLGVKGALKAIGQQLTTIEPLLSTVIVITVVPLRFGRGLVTVEHGQAPGSVERESKRMCASTSAIW